MPETKRATGPKLQAAGALRKCRFGSADDNNVKTVLHVVVDLEAIFRSELLNNPGCRRAILKASVATGDGALR